MEYILILQDELKLDLIKFSNIFSLSFWSSKFSITTFFLFVISFILFPFIYLFILLIFIYKYFVKYFFLIVDIIFLNMISDPATLFSYDKIIYYLKLFFFDIFFYYIPLWKTKLLVTYLTKNYMKILLLKLLVYLDTRLLIFLFILNVKYLFDDIILKGVYSS